MGGLELIVYVIMETDVDVELSPAIFLVFDRFDELLIFLST